MESTFTLGKNIKMIREIKGFSQDYMAKQLNVSQKTYSNIETEKSKLNSELIKQIADILEIDPLKLLSFNEMILFQHCNNSGNLNTYHQATDNEVVLLKSMQQLEDEVKSLRHDMQFLKTIMEQMISNKNENIKQ